MDEAKIAELDAAVAKLEGWAPHLEPIEHWLRGGSYCRDWSMAGPIIERERIALHGFDDGDWIAYVRPEFNAGGELGADEGMGMSDSPLVAAMRAFIASKGVKIAPPWQE